MRIAEKDVTTKLRYGVAYVKNKSYLCTVFFMVLDFKVNEKGAVVMTAPFLYDGHVIQKIGGDTVTLCPPLVKIFVALSSLRSDSLRR